MIPWAREVVFSRCAVFSPTISLGERNCFAPYCLLRRVAESPPSTHTRITRVFTYGDENQFEQAEGMRRCLCPGTSSDGCLPRWSTAMVGAGCGVMRWVGGRPWSRRSEPRHSRHWRHWRHSCSRHTSHHETSVPPLGWERRFQPPSASQPATHTHAHTHTGHHRYHDRVVVSVGHGRPPMGVTEGPPHHHL